ncbi:hypothetical protein ABK040_004969 [Willaertia magna]
MTGGSHLPNITIGECLFKVFIEEKNKQQQKEVTKELKNTFFSKLSKNLSPNNNNNNANKIRSPPTSPNNNNGGNNPFLVTTSALGSSSSSVSTTSSSTTTTGSMSKSEDQIMVQKNLNLNLLHTNDTSPNGANHNTTNGGKEEKKRRKSINDFFKNNIHKLQFKNRLVELRINELLIYAIKDNNKKKLKASISLIGTEITMNKQEITIYGKDKIISLQNSDDSIKEKWFRSLKEQSIINSSQSSSQSLQNLQNNNPILIHNEILNSSVTTSGDNNTQNNFNTLQQPIDLVNQVITQINNLSTTTTHNNTDNHLSQQSLQQNYDFTKEQLSKLSNEFTKINNQSMNYHSLIGQLVMIGENVMNKANIEINSQSIYNMSGGVGILKQGYLRKAGPKEIDQKITINWKKRYCVLTELREFRYIAKIGEAPKGLFNVENAWVSRINLSIIGDDNIVTDIPDDNVTDNVTTIDNIPHDNKSHKNNSGAVNNGDNHYFFQIETPHRVYKFEAFSYESLKSWMTALKLAGANVKSDENDGIVLKGNLERYLKGKWKNLYFILLESKELKYYSKKGSAQKGTILLEDSYICDNLQKTLQNSSLQQNTQNSGEDLTLQFKIYTFDRNYTFKCKDLNTKKMWSTTLQKYGCQYKDMSNNTLQNTQILFKNRLQKYYLKTSDEILLERQEKLQNYIVNEENLKMKLLKNKNKFRVTRGTSNVTNIVTNNNNIVNNVTSGNIPKPPMIPPNTIVTNNNNTIVKVNSTTTNTTTNTINTTSDSSVVTVVNNNTVKKEESVMRNNNIVVQPRPPMGPPPSTYIPSSSSNKSTTTITTSTTLKSNTISTTSNKEKEKKQEEEKIIEQSSKQEEEEKEQIVKQQEKEEKILPKEEEEKVKEQLSTTTTQQQQQQEEEEQKDVATTTTIPIINEPSNIQIIEKKENETTTIIPTTTATETATAIEPTIESIHKEEQQQQQESIKEEKETITTTTTPIAEETITIHPTVSSSSSEPEREPTPPTIITNSLKSLNIQPKSTTNSTSTPTTTHQRDSSIDSNNNNSFSFTLPSVTSNTSIDQLLLLDEHSNNNSINNNSTTTFRMSNPPDSFRYSTTSRFSSATSSVVIDNGSGVLKAGFSHEEFPSKVFNNTIGRIKQYSAKGIREEYQEYGPNYCHIKFM